MPAYPESRRTDTSEVLHGQPVADPFRWLEDPDADEVRRWITAQNEVTEEYLASVASRKEIRERMTALWDYPRQSVPERRGVRLFFTRNSGVQNQDVLYWQADGEEEPHVLLDPNRLSAGGTTALSGYRASPGGRYLAYGLSEVGSDWQEWRVREVSTGRDQADHLRWVKFSTAAWLSDESGFFYGRYDEPVPGESYKAANYNQKLYLHRLGQEQAADALVYERPDEKEWGFGPEVTEDGRYLIIGVWKGTLRQTAILYRDLQDPAAPVMALREGFDAQYTFVGNEGRWLYFFTDHKAPRGRVIAIDLEHPDEEAWREVIPEKADTLAEASLVGECIFANYLHDASSRVEIFDLAGGPRGEIPLPELGTVAGFPGRRRDRETYFNFTGFSTPSRIYRYDLEQHEAVLYWAPAVAFDPDEYVTRQVFYPSRDGTRIPLFVTHRRDLEPAGTHPTFLYGYGGFNIAQTPAFTVRNLVWMEMGGVYAQASLRGGGEYGREWHEGGTKLNKQNVFDDFIAGAEWLIAEGITCREKLAIGGRSNGGLLAGACLTQRPDLFGACLVGVGVLDMLRFHKFTIGWAWTSDYGSPENPEEFAALRAYSPYHNLNPGAVYPPTLITTADHDDRVFPAHSFKFAAALQAAQGGEAPILIRIDTDAGHGVGKPTSKQVAEYVDQWAFLARCLDLS